MRTWLWLASTPRTCRFTPVQQTVLWSPKQHFSSTRRNEISQPRMHKRLTSHDTRRMSQMKHFNPLQNKWQSSFFVPTVPDQWSYFSHSLNWIASCFHSGNWLTISQIYSWCTPCWAGQNHIWWNKTVALLSVSNKCWLTFLLGLHLCVAAHPPRTRLHPLPAPNTTTPHLSNQ